MPNVRFVFLAGLLALTGFTVPAPAQNAPRPAVQPAAPAYGQPPAALPGPLAPTPFARWGEAPALVLLAGLALWSIRRRASKHP